MLKYLFYCQLLLFLLFSVSVAAGTVRGRDSVPTLVAHHAAGMVAQQRFTLVAGHLSPCSYGHMDLTMVFYFSVRLWRREQSVVETTCQH